jgi:hypothetical protein
LITAAGPKGPAVTTHQSAQAPTDATLLSSRRYEAHSLLLATIRISEGDWSLGRLHKKRGALMNQFDHEAAVAIFIRSKGVTRCPTACVLPTQGLPNAADQAALIQYASARNRLRRMKMAHQRSVYITCDAAMGQKC